jgi:hypothetical protein
MRDVRGGLPKTTRARGDKIATATAIAPVFNETRRIVQGRSSGGNQPRLSARTQRRVRYIKKIEACPDAEIRWRLLLDRLGEKLDINDDVDKALDAAVDAPPEALAYYAHVSGGAR